MDLDKYLKTINELNLVLESLEIKDVKQNIRKTKEKMDDLDIRIQNYLNRKDLPFKEIRIEFLKPIKTAVRGANDKYEIEVNGRDTYDVVGFDSDFIVIRDKKWYDKIGLIIFYKTLDDRIEQKSEYQLIYNKVGDLSGYNKTRSTSKKDTFFKIISKK